MNNFKTVILKKLHQRFYKSNIVFSSALLECNKEDIEKNLIHAWQDPSLPQRQFDTNTLKQVEDYRKGLPVEPFDVLVNTLRDNISNA